MKRLALSCLMVLASAAGAAKLPGPLVETEWLAGHRDQVTILDVRADPRGFVIAPQYVKDKKTGKERLARIGGHIPGARLIDYKKIRTERQIGGRKVTRMIPPREQFQKVMQEAGVDGDRPLVIVSQGTGSGDMTMATRLYWQLKYYGYDELAILNGGLAKWLMEKRPVATGPAPARRGNWTARTERKELLATSDEVAEASAKRTAQLVDTRPISQYLGTYHKSYVYAPGHIPGAKNFPNELLTLPAAPSTFVKVQDLKALAKELGIQADAPTITYCNSGHLASGSWFVFHELLGNPNTKLYDGSMHEWTLEKRPTVRLKWE